MVKFYVAQMFKLNDRQKLRAGKGVNKLIIRLQFQRNSQWMPSYGYVQSKESYSELDQTFKMQNFSKIINGWSCYLF